MRFTGTDHYVATEDLKVAVNAAIVLERPLLVKGEPGTGKTVLAEEIARAVGAPLLTWHVKSTTKAAAGPLRIRRRLAAARFPARRSRASATSATTSGAASCGRPSRPRPGPVLLIDEIDKADIEFPNDLLLELDRMEFHVYETGETVKAERRPIVIITSNNEKELPDAFLRRCFFHYIRFPDADTMARIVEVHYPGIKRRLVEEALRLFFEVREVPGLKKKPSTSELLDWLKLLMSEDIGPEQLRERDPRKLIPPLHGALLKNEQDVSLFEKLAFMSRREGQVVRARLTGPHGRGSAACASWSCVSPSSFVFVTVFCRSRRCRSCRGRPPRRRCRRPSLVTVVLSPNGVSVRLILVVLGKGSAAEHQNGGNVARRFMLQSP